MCRYGCGQNMSACQPGIAPLELHRGWLQRLKTEVVHQKEEK